VTSRRRIRLFLDSNVITAAVVSSWGLDKAVLSLCAAKICRMVLGRVVKQEVENNLPIHTQSLPALQAARLLRDYDHLIEMCEPEIVPLPALKEVRANRRLIRHEADVPVLLSAMHSRPDWLLTNNRKHFNRDVQQNTGLRIATPADFFRELAKLLSL
jgi:predicted nucleic acid-binding protein